MKRTLISILIISGIFTASAQEEQVSKKTSVIESGSSINIPTGKVNKVFVQPRENNQLLKSAQSDKINIEVEYVDFPEDAKKAFEYAVTIWEGLLTSTVPLKIKATWKKFDNGALALGRPSTFHKNFGGAQFSDVYYPVTLAEKLSGENMNSFDADIVCSFNSSYNWYFGTDGNTPTSKYDFVTAVLHEIVHGLGFSGFLDDNGQSGFFGNSNNQPSIYDYYLCNNQNQQLADHSIFSSPSGELHKQLTSNAVKFYSPDNLEGYEQTTDWVYAPSTWSAGASIYHLETGSGLMDAYMNKGEALHSPEESTLEILSEMGWNSIVFDFEELKDMEEPVAELPVEVGFLSNIAVDGSKMKITFSKDYFISTGTTEMQYDASSNKFNGELPLENFQGNLQYYFTLETEDGKIYNLPSTAPARKFVLRVGPDYSAPTVVHNPVKVISKNEPHINLSARAQDNIGINSVKIEYKLNGVAQEPVALQNEENDIYKGILDLAETTLNGDKFEYRIIAEDKSSRGNKRILPSSGYYSVEVFQSQSPVRSYVTDFEYSTSDFIVADFAISPLAGFSSSVLHTKNPYPVSAFENEKYNLIAQLKTPVILEEGGQMTFDEVVLVEPGQSNTNYKEEMFWDYVIVEGSKDNGRNWMPLTEGYDSGCEDSWYNTFKSSFINNNSNANGQESMFLKQTINLTESSNFNVGDTVIFRFRLASDKSVSGWGWAIDNLEIQKGFATDAETIAQSDVNVYPNPFTNSFYVDCSGFQDYNQVEILVTDMFGKIVYQESEIDAFYASKKQVDLTDKSPGMYLVNISDGNSIISKNKIIKN